MEQNLEEGYLEVLYYPSLRVGLITKDGVTGFVLNPFNFGYYGTREGNFISNEIIKRLTNEVKDITLDYEGLVTADLWVQENQERIAEEVFQDLQKGAENLKDES